MTLDLTMNPACYTYWLAQIDSDVDTMYRNSKCTLAQMKAVVSNIVRNANDTPARKRFLKRLSFCGDKMDVHNLCYNSINAGKRYQQN